MIILGDIGNTETKICLVNNNNKIIKKIIIPSKGKKLNLLNKYFKKLDFSSIDKILFCSVEVVVIIVQRGVVSLCRKYKKNKVCRKIFGRRKIYTITMLS